MFKNILLVLLMAGFTFAAPITPHNDEITLWNEIQSTNTVEDYTIYLDTYPKGKYLTLAKARIKKLNNEQAQTQEQQSWDTAQSTNTQASYNQYLTNYPKGKFTALAKVKLNKFKLQASSKEPFQDCPNCPKMVNIPAGEFMMGSNESTDEQPIHRVTVPAFAMGITEITKEQFLAFVSDTGYISDAEKNSDNKDGCYVDKNGNDDWGYPSGTSWKNPNFTQSNIHPAVCISHNDASAYAQWLSRKTNHTYRLPTEAEWEYAARAGTSSKWYFGENENDLCQYANIADQSAKRKYSSWHKAASCDDGYLYTAPVASFKPNAFGLYDMSGNVREWVQDWYISSYTSTPTDGSPNTTGKQKYRSNRGGSWNYNPYDSRSASRSCDAPNFRSSSIGFRILRTK